MMYSYGVCISTSIRKIRVLYRFLSRRTAIALQQYFSPDGDAQPPMLNLLRFEAAMLELSAARADLDAIFGFRSNLQGGQRDVGLHQENA